MVLFIRKFCTQPLFEEPENAQKILLTDVLKETCTLAGKY